MRLPFDNLAITVLCLGSLAIFCHSWLLGHPEHNPWAPLTLTEPQGWATSAKLRKLRSDPDVCRSFLTRSGVTFEALPPIGEGECRSDDRQVISSPAQARVQLVPRGAQATCSVDAGLAWWLHHGVQPAARSLLGSPVARIEHFGTKSCRRIGGGERWSEHARGNAIDIGAFVLADGRRISVRRDWRKPGKPADFLHAVRDRACASFATVLSPDYNAAHADHLHLDQAQWSGGWAMCR